MDTEAKKQGLENQKLALEQYLQHPVTQEVLRDLDEQAEAVLHQILEMPVSFADDSFFKREQSLGHLRGLRRTKARVMENLEDVKDQLKEIGL